MGPKELAKFEDAASRSNDKYLCSLFSEMNKNQESSWTIVELCSLYESYSKTAITRYKLLKEVKRHFGNDIILLSATGMCTLVMFKSQAGKLIKFVEDTNKEDIDTSTYIAPLAKKIRDECVAAKSSNQKLNTRLDRNSVMSQCSDTFIELLNEISHQFNDSPAALLAASIVTSKVNSRPTDLQIALGLMVDRKRLVQDLYKYGATCSYDEVKVFKRSTAIATIKDMEQQASTFDPKDGMIQVAEDNFDRNIASANCLESTHALATVYIQSPSSLNCSSSTYEEIPAIPRITSRGPIKYSQDENEKVYFGTDKPELPAEFVKDLDPSDNVKKMQDASFKRAEELDLEFFKLITSDTDSVPEYGGFLVKHCRD